MYELSHKFKFINPIRSELIKILELFDLTLNTINIGTSSVETTTSVETFFTLHRCLFYFFSCL